MSRTLSHRIKNISVLCVLSALAICSFVSYSYYCLNERDKFQTRLHGFKKALATNEKFAEVKVRTVAWHGVFVTGCVRTASDLDELNALVRNFDLQRIPNHVYVNPVEYKELYEADVRENLRQ